MIASGHLWPEIFRLELLETFYRQKDVINFVVLLDSLEIKVGDAIYVSMNIPSKTEVAKVEREHVISAGAHSTLFSSVPSGHQLKELSRCTTGSNTPNTARRITKAYEKGHGSRVAANLFTGAITLTTM